MLERDPDLEDLLELPVIGEGQPQPVDPEVIRRQAGRGFESVAYDRDGLLGVSRRLGGWWTSGTITPGVPIAPACSAIYRSVSQEILDRYVSFPDEDGEIAAVVTRCVDEMGGAWKLNRSRRPARASFTRSSTSSGMTRTTVATG